MKSLELAETAASVLHEDTIVVSGNRSDEGDEEDEICLGLSCLVLVIATTTQQQKATFQRNQKGWGLLGNVQL